MEVDFPDDGQKTVVGWVSRGMMYVGHGVALGPAAPGAPSPTRVSAGTWGVGVAAAAAAEARHY